MCDINLYHAIAESRGEFDSRHSHSNADDLLGEKIDDAELKLRQDLSALKACWYGDKWAVRETPTLGPLLHC